MPTENLPQAFTACSGLPHFVSAQLRWSSKSMRIPTLTFERGLHLHSNIFRGLQVKKRLKITALGCLSILPVLLPSLWLSDPTSLTLYPHPKPQAFSSALNQFPTNSSHSLIKRSTSVLVYLLQPKTEAFASYAIRAVSYGTPLH